MTRTYTLHTYAVHHRSDARRRLIIRAASPASAMRAAAAHWGLRSQIGLSLTTARGYTDQTIIAATMPEPRIIKGG